MTFGQAGIKKLRYIISDGVTRLTAEFEDGRIVAIRWREDDEKQRSTELVYKMRQRNPDGLQACMSVLRQASDSQAVPKMRHEDDR